MFTAKIFAEKAASTRTTPVCTRMKETIILLGIAGLLFRPACQAQVSIAQPLERTTAAECFTSARASTLGRVPMDDGYSTNCHGGDL